jgi:carnitine O-acetyltransferase
MIPELSIALRFAETRLADLIQQTEFQTLDFPHYGKNFMTSAGYSPDAFVQMAYQAAYYGLYGRIENTYEPAMTKMYLHGRTEAIRPVTAESVEFVKTFWADNPVQQKVDALKKATQKHTAMTKECIKAEGQDRHLYALYCVWQRAVNDDGAEAASSTGFSSNGYSSPADADSRSVSDERPISPNGGMNGSSRSPGPPLHQTPALFTDSGWEKINNTILSTSNCGNPSLRHFGFGPVSGDGFGIGYIIKDDSISICASSKHRQTKRFVDSIESYLLEIRRILKLTRKEGAGPKQTRAREIEARRPSTIARIKSRGRIIKAETSKAGMETPTTDAGEVEDDGLGGCKLEIVAWSGTLLTLYQMASLMQACCCKR